MDDAFKERRRDLLLQAFRDCSPDIVIIEAFPFGRRQMRFELLPLLEAIKAIDAQAVSGNVRARHPAGAREARPE